MQCRAAAYRVLRHALVDTDRVNLLGGSVDWYIVKYVLFQSKRSRNLNPRPSDLFFETTSMQ